MILTNKRLPQKIDQTKSDENNDGEYSKSLTESRKKVTTKI